MLYLLLLLLLLLSEFESIDKSIVPWIIGCKKRELCKSVLDVSSKSNSSSIYDNGR